MASMTERLMNIEQLMERELAGKTEVLGANLPSHVSHHKSHMTSYGIEPGPPRWKPGD
jgi:hypothetical protein